MLEHLSFKYQISETLQNSINWLALYSTIHSVEDLNSKKNRFKKSDIIERSGAKYSSGFLVHIDEDGRDYKTINNNYIELKYETHALFTNKKRLLKDKISVTLKNSRGTNTHNTLPSDYAEYLIIFDRIGCAIVETKFIFPYLKINGDGIVLNKCPSELFDIIFILPLGTQLKQKEESFIVLYDELVEKYIDQFGLDNIEKYDIIELYDVKL